MEIPLESVQIKLGSRWGNSLVSMLEYLLSGAKQTYRRRGPNFASGPQTDLTQQPQVVVFLFRRLPAGSRLHGDHGAPDG